MLRFFRVQDSGSGSVLSIFLVVLVIMIIAAAARNAFDCWYDGYIC